MATEAPQERPHEASVTSDEPTIKIDTDAQNVDSDQPHVNGDTASTATDEIENKQISDIVDDLVNSAEVSISGGSDTEASRSKLGNDDKGHGRTSSSVKKPASFKAVSVNKTFLAAKGPSTNAPSRVNDKSAAASGASTPGIASLTAARPRLIAKSGSGLVTKSSTGLNGATGTAPDPNAVWNKNRPVPPPEPKKLTDEELKKYGIHMATRLHTDDTKGQANWADIDDDDDDWAPESITWKDGTKITIPHVEEHPQPPVAPTPAPIAEPAPVQRMVVKEVEKPKSPAPTILASKPSLPSGKGLVFTKGAPEKPTLVAKPPAPPTPVKSPWAQIPKVDNASPVVVEPPTSQQGPTKFGPSVPGPTSSTPPPPKEIAADDFSRTPWREGPGAPNRELFNSQSGRYEPVTDRRGSVRADQHSRPAAVLQRTSHETQGPAEPSAAFQTSRVSEQHNPYGRRRGSSIVSGGSGSYMHLKGHEQPLAPPELLTARRESFTAVTDGPRSPVRNFSPSAQHPGQRPLANQAWPPHISPASVHSLPHQQPTESPLPAGPPPTAAMAAPVVTEDAIALQKRLMHEKRELAKKRRQEEEAREEAERRERIRLKLEALGPAPESRSAKKAATKDEVSAEPQIQRETPAPQGQKPAVLDTKPSETAPPPLEPETKPETLVNGVPDQPQPPKMPSKDNVEVRSQQQGPNVGGWPTGPRQPGPRQPFSHDNVWASPYSNDSRSLGNGTFNPDLVSKRVPGPIAPPSTSRVPSGPAARPAPIGPPGQVSRRPPGAQPRNQIQNAWAAAVQADDVVLTKEMRALRDAKEQELQAEGLDFASVQAPIKDTWRPTKVDDDGRRFNEKSQQTYHATKAPGWAKSGESVAQQPQGQPSGSAHAASSEYVQQAAAAGPPAEVASGSILGTAMQQTKSSRFFPSRDVRQEATAGTDNRGRSSSPSPPPPDMAGHPAFDGDVAHPHVSLPRPQPVVRLPPPKVAPAPIAAPKPGPGPSFGWAAPAPYKELETASAPTGPASNWQARIDSLLGVKASSHAKSVPVDSASRRSLEHPQYAQSATVSLPRGLFKNLPSDNDGSPTSKDPAETCFEEQEMGSLPPVRLPKETPEAAWHPSAAPKPLPKKLWPSVSSAEQLPFYSDTNGNGTVINIFAPGMNGPKVITIPFSRNRSNPRRGGRGGRNPSSQQYRGGKGREPSASHSNDQTSSSSGPSGNRGARGGFPRRDNWSRHSGPAIQT
ncbi:hypothetical protein CONLIGDRAFT_678783 [Coniochaeta ligniaria NRRL 30616]|uniref:Uncharacterized protein n=1 Tax=Coniochaeta ligniaria NRRL 30616 TaxID=1408157 RepID=A0A1J7IY12_9PEZI|nr:hypothetical protein CONLIGDRAFT_678783 [Coniochaeta ligniaria NRRL 30616]